MFFHDIRKLLCNFYKIYSFSCSNQKNNVPLYPDMNRHLLHSIEWAVAILAYAYLAYKLATYEHYDIVADSLRAMGLQQGIALGLCIALMPVNMLLEAWRWRTLMAEGERRLSWREAQRHVYYSKLAGLITPWRLGEYPARALLMEEGALPRVLSMGAVGSATMTMAIVGLGAVALAFDSALVAQLGGSYLYSLAVVVLILAVALYFAPRWLVKWLKGEPTKAEWTGLLWRSLAQSVIRLLCWCVQLALVLYALKALELSDLALADCWMQMPVYYLLVTITPNVPIAEVGVRGAWAMLLFGTVNAALAGVLLWLINTVLPCLVWPMIKKRV